MQTGCRWCSTLSSREAVNQNQDRSESDELCDEPDTHSGPHPGPVDIPMCLKLHFPPEDCTVPFSARTRCYSSQLFYCHLVSTNSARDAKWCKPKQSAECGSLSSHFHLADSSDPALSALKSLSAGKAQEQCWTWDTHTHIKMNILLILRVLKVLGTVHLIPESGDYLFFCFQILGWVVIPVIF